MKTNIIFLVVLTVCIIFGNNVIESWWSFFGGAVFALLAREVGVAILRRAGYR